MNRLLCVVVKTHISESVCVDLSHVKLPDTVSLLKDRHLEEAS